MEEFNLYPKGVESGQKLDNNSEKEKVSKILELVGKLNESGETFPFPEINPEIYLKMKKTDEEYPGYTTPIDKIVDRCKNEGVKVVLGKYPESGNIFILPAGSNDIEMDSLPLDCLAIENIQNTDLVELIGLTVKK